MMILAEMAAFDNVKELTEMADDLATFVQQAAARLMQMQGHGDAGERWGDAPRCPAVRLAGGWTGELL